MSDSHRLSASLVLYKNRMDILEPLIQSFHASSITPQKFLVIDNSPTAELQEHFKDAPFDYRFMGDNLGFGRAHNVALREVLDRFDFHLIVNPDIQFDPSVLKELLTFMESHPDVGAVMPKVLNPDGSLQTVCRLFPSPADLILRRFFPKVGQREKNVERYELRFSGYDRVMDVPCLSGCFLLVRTSVLKEVGLFDERFFMYLEDYDLCRRIGMKARTVFFPQVHVTHGYGRGSYKNWRLLKYHMKSAIMYFNKYGWIVDPYRRRTNERVLEKLGYYRHAMS